jgi:hypothetical protein
MERDPRAFLWDLALDLAPELKAVVSALLEASDRSPP